MNKTTLLELINLIIYDSVAHKENFKELTGYEQAVRESGLDSLEWTVLFLYVCDIFQIADHIPEEVIDQSVEFYVEDLIQFINTYGTIPDIEFIEGRTKKHFKEFTGFKSIE